MLLQLRFPDFTRNKMLLLSGLTQVLISQSFLPCWSEDPSLETDDSSPSIFQAWQPWPHILSRLQLHRLSPYSFHLLVATSPAVSLPLRAGGWACHSLNAPSGQRLLWESFHTGWFGPEDAQFRKYSPNGWVPSMTLLNALRYFLSTRILSRQPLKSGKACSYPLTKRSFFSSLTKSLSLSTYLLLATGRAISNLAKNWKYCSSVCSVKPVPTSSILRSSALMTPFLATDLELLMLKILCRHSESQTGSRK